MKDWAHCPGEQNPADVRSKGEQASTLKQMNCGGRVQVSFLDQEILGHFLRSWKPHKSTEEEKVVMTLAYIKAKDKMLNVLD